MGREIRRVPKGWEHPRDESHPDHFQSMRDETFADAAKNWWDEAVRWHAGDVPDSLQEARNEHPWYWQWAGEPPEEKYYRPEWTAPADCYQIYETVSEGSPVSPVFETLDAMIEWMIQPIDRTSPYNRGADWQCMQGMSREQAERFAKDGYAPSLISGPGIGVVAGHRAP